MASGFLKLSTRFSHVYYMSSIRVQVQGAGLLWRFRPGLSIRGSFGEGV